MNQAKNIQQEKRNSSNNVFNYVHMSMDLPARQISQLWSFIIILISLLSASSSKIVAAEAGKNLYSKDN